MASVLLRVQASLIPASVLCSVVWGAAAGLQTSEGELRAGTHRCDFRSFGSYWGLRRHALAISPNLSWLRHCFYLSLLLDICLSHSISAFRPSRYQLRSEVLVPVSLKCKIPDWLLGFLSQLFSIALITISPHCLSPDLCFSTVSSSLKSCYLKGRNFQSTPQNQKVCSTK